MEVSVELKKKVVKAPVLSISQGPEASVAESRVVFCRSKRPVAGGGAYGTGRRKNSVARVWILPGKGKITVNGRDVHEYFSRAFHMQQVLRPFEVTDTIGRFDVVCTAKGGGVTGQAGSIKLGVARALDCIDHGFHALLRQDGALTRDPRVVERKKYGRKKARRGFQFSKR